MAIKPKKVDLTDSLVEGLKPALKRYRLYDRQITTDGPGRGFHICVEASGQKFFATTLREGTIVRNHRLGPFPGTTVAEARLAAILYATRLMKEVAQDDDLKAAQVIQKLTHQDDLRLMAEAVVALADKRVFRAVLSTLDAQFAQANGGVSLGKVIPGFFRARQGSKS